MSKQTPKPKELPKSKPVTVISPPNTAHPNPVQKTAPPTGSHPHPHPAPPVPPVPKPRIRILFPVHPLSRGNLVGLGILLGFGLQGYINRNVLFFPLEKSDVFTLVLLALHVSCYVCVLGNFFYQLTFWAFRHYNDKLVRNPSLRSFIHGLIEIMFGLCLGGILLYIWDVMVTTSTCIPKGHCPSSRIMGRIAALKIETCKTEGGFCENFFHKMPAMFQVFKSIAATSFVLYLRENRKLSISVKVEKKSV